MKKLLLAMTALAALSLLVPSTGVAQTAEGPNGWYNHFGIYTTQDANPANASYSGAPGQVTVYVVATNPRNYSVGNPGSGVEADIQRLGGFEFQIIVPAGVFVLSAVLPPFTVNFHTDPNNYLAGTNIEVVNNAATCLTLLLGAFTQTPDLLFYLAPVNSVPSVPGHLALTDFNDDFRLTTAYPASGSLDAPVFGLWPTEPIVPTEDASWGDLKSLYR